VNELWLCLFDDELNPISVLSVTICELKKGVAMENLDINKIAKMIDHTELKSSSGQKKILNLCNEAKMFGFVRFVSIRIT